MKLKLWLACAALFFSVTGYAGERQAGTNSDTQTNTTSNEPDASITELEALFAAKKIAELKPLLATLRAHKPPHMAVLFISGMLASHEGDYAKATDEFRAMLTRDPSLVRPRLELALALQKEGDRQSAKYHYEQALAANLPNPVRRNIYKQIDDIRERMPSLRMSLDFVSDSNPKLSTNSRVIYIGGLPYTLNDSSEEKVAYGTTVSADVHWPLPVDPSWFAHGYAEVTEYPSRELDSMYGQIAVGKRFDFGQHNVSVEIGRHISSFQDHQQYDGWLSRGMGFFRISPKLGVTTDLGYKTYTYANLPYLDGSMQYLNVTGIYVSQPTQRIDVSAGVSKYNAEEDAYTYTQPSLSIRFMQEWQGGWLTGVRLQGLVADYSAQDPFFGEKRHDKEARLEFDVLNRKLKFWSFSPRLLIGYVERDSNLDLYSYQRFYARLGVSTEF